RRRHTRFSRDWSSDVCSSDLAAFVWITLMTAFAGATLDIAVDAYRVEIAPKESQGALVATYSLGYRIALIVTGALALVLADHVRSEERRVGKECRCEQTHTDE